MGVEHRVLSIHLHTLSLFIFFFSFLHIYALHIHTYTMLNRRLLQQSLRYLKNSQNLAVSYAAKNCRYHDPSLSDQQPNKTITLVFDNNPVTLKFGDSSQTLNEFIEHVNE